MARIIIFSTNYFPNVGGAEVAIKEISERLKEHYEFNVITPRYSLEHEKEERIGSVTVYRVGIGNIFGKFGIPIFGTIKAISLHKKKKYDLIWSMMASQASVSASFFKMLTKLPLVLTIQEGDEEKHLKRFVMGNDFLYKLLIRPWYALVFKKANRITAISTYLKNRARELNSNVPIDVIPNGVDILKFEKKAPSAIVEKVRSGLGLSPSDTLLIHTGRLVEKNALDVVIRSLSLLPKSVHFLSLGEGYLRKELEELVVKEGVKERVHFAASVLHDEMIKYLAASDIFIRPSRSEGMGNSFVEAMAARKPVIGTRAGGIADFLFGNDSGHDQTGFVVRVDSPDDVAKQVLYITSHKGEVAEVLERAYDFVKAGFNWDSIAKNMDKKAFGPLLHPIS